MKAMILAAGMGTRLKPFTDKHPKALARVNGQTLLEIAIRYLQRFGIKDIVVNVHHFAEQVESTLIQHKGFGSTVTISDERADLLDTGGGVLKAVPFFKEEHAFVVMNVDILTNLDLDAMIRYHFSKEGAATLAVMRRSSTRYLWFDSSEALCGWENRHTGEIKRARENTAITAKAFSGIQVISPELLQETSLSGKCSLIDIYLDRAASTDIFGYDHTGDLLMDAGKPADLERAAAYSWLE